MRYPKLTEGVAYRKAIRATALTLAVFITLGLGVFPYPVWAGAEAGLSSYYQGIQAYRRGEYGKALVALKEAKRNIPDNPNIHYYMAIVLDKLARPEEAILHYQHVSRYGRDQKVVDYSRYRLDALQRDRAGTLTAVRMGMDRSSGIEVRLKPHQNALMVEATLNDRVHGTFIVDTGATYTSISREMADQLGTDAVPIGTVKITTANGRIEVPKILIKRVTLDGLEARNVEATVIDVRKGSSFSGLLGLSFIRQFKLTIDPKEGHLVFHSI